MKPTLLFFCAALLSISGCQTSSERTGHDSRPSAQAFRSPATDLPSGNSQADPAESARINTELAAAYLQAGNIKVALDVVQTALRAEPHNVAALTVQALIYTAIKDMAAAKETFTLALQIAPGDPDLNHNYGVYLCQMERPSEAITYFDRALSARLYAHQANSYASKGSCLEQLGKRDEARKQYQEALKVDQFHPSALYGLATMDYADGRAESARNSLQFLHQTSGATAKSLYLAYQVAGKLKNTLEQSAFSDALERKYPDSEEAKSLRTKRQLSLTQ